jgi:hypothetical protein
MLLIMLIGSGLAGAPVVSVAAEPSAESLAAPAAPTFAEAHHYFGALVGDSDVQALYETRSRSGQVLGFEKFPVQDYRWAACDSALVLKNGVRIDIDWTVVDKTLASDGTVALLQGHNVLFPTFHMLSLEGGIKVLPANSIQRLILAISDELSRNRLANAVDLIASACRVKSKFD